VNVRSDPIQIHFIGKDIQVFVAFF